MEHPENQLAPTVGSPEDATTHSIPFTKMPGEQTCHSLSTLSGGAPELVPSPQRCACGCHEIPKGCCSTPVGLHGKLLLDHGILISIKLLERRLALQLRSPGAELSQTKEPTAILVDRIPQLRRLRLLDASLG